MASLTKNVIYNSILTTSRYIFPLITYPYVSRVLGVTNIGICNFVDGIINYYSLFAMMGINAMAIREIASSKNNEKELSKTFSSLLTLNLITTFAMIAILVTCIFCVPKMYEHKSLMFIGVGKLLFNSLLIEWFYKGLENFKYITVRTIIVRFLYVVLTFILIRDANDYPYYYLLIVSTIIINATVNMIYSRNFVRFTLRGLNIKTYIKPFVTLGIYLILTSFYTTFNVVFLGFVSGETEVGYYSTATKVHGIILALFTAFTNVMMPRMATLLGEGRRDEFDKLFQKSIRILFAFSFPLMCASTVFTDQIIRWVSGPGYEAAIPCMQFVLPLIFVIGYEQILVYQILMPLKNDRSILINSIVGASVGVLANIILVPHLNSVGSSIVWLLSELSVFVMAQYYVRKSTGISIPYNLILKYLLVSMPIIGVLVLLHIWNPLGLYTIILAFILTGIYFLSLELFCFKNEIIINLLKKISQ